jgi:TrmH family RNA methyltransferase
VSKPHAIQSKDNPAFKALRERLSAGGARRTHALIPGDKLIEAYVEAQDAPGGRRLRPVGWVKREEAGTHGLERRMPLPTLIVPEARMKELTDQPSAPELALEVALGPDPIEPLGPRALGLWALQDPGNLGAVMRSAAAFGFTDLLLGPGCTDPFTPKALRGAMGATFLMRLRRVTALQAPAWILDGGPDAIALDTVPWKEPLCLWVGSEGMGWKGVELPAGAQRVAIPMQGVESLNAAVAAGIACFEVQRRLQ